MSIIIDLISSTIVAMYVIMLGLRINMNVSSNTTSSSTSVNIQEAMVSTVATIESDLKKIGYGLVDPTTAIAIASSNKIRFRARMTQYGPIDSVEWYVGSPIAKYAPRDVRILYRKYGNQAATVAATGVTTFKLKYLNQDGDTTSVTSNVVMIELTLGISSTFTVADRINPDDPSKDRYINTLWRQGRLSLRNMKRHG